MPIGILCVLLTCWGVASLISLSAVSFPASVALLLVLFFALVLCERILGDRKTKKIVHVIDIPVSLALFQTTDDNSWYSRLGLPFDTSMYSSRPHSVSARLFHFDMQNLKDQHCFDKLIADLIQSFYHSVHLLVVLK